jgi:lipopolysaccharide transport system ATP-binding protein
MVHQDQEGVRGCDLNDRRPIDHDDPAGTTPVSPDAWSSFGLLAPVLNVENVSKMYRIYDRPADRLKQMLLGRMGWSYGREFWALRDVSFELRKGETVGIIGRNGSGKSTLLQIIAGTLTPTEGVVTVEGRVAALLELGTGFNPEFTGRENVLTTGAILGLASDDMERRFDEIASFADIGEFIDQPVKYYSSGMFVRLAFAVQACVDPDILIVDEALSVGDIFFQQKCAKRFQDLMDRGTAILLVTHDTQAVARLCNRAILLADGRTECSGEPKFVLERYTALRRGSRIATTSASDPVVHPRADTATPLPPIPAQAPRHGEGGCHITGAALQGPEGQAKHVVEQGEEIRVIVEFICDRDGIPPNVGFQMLDRLGNLIFGTNTFMLSQAMAPPDAGSSVRVCFAMPALLGVGEYTLSVAVASYEWNPGHIYDWVDQALRFVVVRSRTPWTAGWAFCPIAVTWGDSGEDLLRG